MSYPNYLIHFNRNHDKLGRFATGDGDGDGRREAEGDRSRRTPNSGRSGYEGGGGGRFGGSGRKRNEASSKPSASNSREKQNVTRTANTGYHREGLRGAEKVSNSYLTKPVNTSASLSGNKRASTSAPNGIFKAAGRNPKPEPHKPSWEDNGNGTSTPGGGGGGSVQTAIENGKKYIESVLVMDDISDDLEEKIKKNKIRTSLKGGTNNKDTHGYGKVDTSTKRTVDYTHRKGTGKSYGENRHVSGK